MAFTAVVKGKCIWGPTFLAGPRQERFALFSCGLILLASGWRGEQADVIAPMAHLVRCTQCSVFFHALRAQPRATPSNLTAKRGVRRVVCQVFSRSIVLSCGISPNYPWKEQPHMLSVSNRGWRGRSRRLRVCFKIDVVDLFPILTRSRPHSTTLSPEACPMRNGLS